MSRPRTGPEGDATRRTVEVVFATLHRLLGVGIGEHLGYLLTGLWTLLVAGLDRRDERPAGRGSAVVGLPIGLALLIGSLEFVGPNERDGWAVAGDDRPDRLHRLVDLAHRAGRRPPDLVARRLGRRRRAPVRFLGERASLRPTR